MTGALASMTTAASLGVAGTSQAGDACPSWQVVASAVDLLARRDGVAAPLNDLHDATFKAFADKLVDYTLSQFSTEHRLCKPDRYSGAIEVVFVRLPLVASAEFPDGPAFATDAPWDLRVDSPWLTARLNRQTKAIRIVTTWSERQFLVDQVLMAGTAAQDVRPISSLQYAAYVKEYSDNFLLRADIPEGSSADSRIPPDIFWLFRHAWQTDRSPFENSAEATLQAIISAAMPGYLDLLQHLIHDMAQSGMKSTRYEDINDRKLAPLRSDYAVNMR